jgi:hypothetical protein
MRRSSAFLALPVVLAFACSDQPTSPTDALALSPVFAHAPATDSDFFYAFEEFGVPSAVAKNGDEINISLNVDATFGFHPKTISGGGIFTINHAAGGMTTGTWTATKLISFKSYGSTQVNGDILFGGSLKLQITLSTGEKAILRLTCTDFGNAPPGIKQGIVLQVVGGKHFTGRWEFDGDVPSGDTQGATFFVEKS